MSPRFMGRALPLLAVAVLVVNDHVLKPCFPGLITGKLSDFAGLFFFPLFLTDALALARGASRRTLLAACLATALVFALVKTTALGHSVYCIGLGALQAPVRGSFHRVRMTMDATDLVALVSCLAAYVYAARRFSLTGLRSRPPREWPRQHVE